MQCYWEGCLEINIEDITAHINKHIESQKDNYTCMWEGCKRYGEKQSNKYTLQAHVRKHTNEKPYKCNKCTKKYTRSDALNKHLKHHQKMEEEMDELISISNVLLARKKIITIEIENEICNKNRKNQYIEILNKHICKKLEAGLNNENNYK
ncbi:hypothetical protein COBT_001745 [Conglomerata obtusa]